MFLFFSPRAPLLEEYLRYDTTAINYELLNYQLSTINYQLSTIISTININITDVCRLLSLQFHHPLNIYTP